MTGPSHRVRAKALGLALLLPLPVLAAENLMLVLDASGSMWGQIDGRSKVEIARETVAGVLRDWPAESALGLVAYGHRRKGDCADIETLIPVGPLDAAAYLKTVNGLNALGMTPLSAAVRHAADALKSSEQKATVILVSDGEETCKLDPCAVGTALEQAGVDFTAHVVGFDVSDRTHQAQLRCLAENTGGRYFNARDAAELGSAIAGAVKASTQPALPPATATLDAAAAVAAGNSLEVRWTGPADDGDFIGIYDPSRPRSAELAYAYAKAATDGAGRGSATLRAPADAGNFVVRYISPRRAQSQLAERPVQVTEVVASITAADSVPAGVDIEVVAKGPAGAGNWVGFAPPGAPPAAYLDYSYVDDRVTSAAGMPITLTPPADPGEYELRYVINERERVLLSRPIRVVAASASVRGPATAMAGDTVQVVASGPEGDQHWIGFAPAGSEPGAYRDYARPQGPTSALRLMVPTEPGDYELRYVLNERETIVASQPVKVTAPVITIDAPTAAAVGSAVTVQFSGPRHGSHWIGFVPRGGDGGTYFAYDYVPEQGERVELTAPDVAGDYDLVFVIDNSVVARRPIAVE